MQSWHIRAGQSSLSCSSASIPQAQQPLSSSLLHFAQSYGVPRSLQKPRLLGLSGVDPSSTRSAAGISTNAHRTAVSLQARPTNTQEHLNHSSHHHRQLKDDGSLKIIMLLSLSLTLLLIPWVSHHPEFLIAPVLLAFTPVVGNGVRPVLKEVAAGVVTVMKLFGMAAWFDITHELPPHQHNHQHHLNGHHNHQGSHHSSSGSSNQRGSMQQQQQYGRDGGLYQQQQQQQQRPSGPYSPWPQQPQPRPSGPHSAWPNPAYTTLAQQQQQQAGVTNAGGVMSHPVSNDADVDWAPSSPPDPNRGDPGSLQHLRQVLAADMQTEAELGQQQQQQQQRGLPAAAGSSASTAAIAATMGVQSAPRQQSPAGSPQMGNSPAASVSSIDAGDLSAYQQQPQQQQPQQQQQQAAGKQQHSRDPRVLSREAKQQLYRDHHNHMQQGGGGGSGGSS